MQSALPPPLAKPTVFFYGAVTGLGLGMAQFILVGLTYSDNGPYGPFWLQFVVLILVWLAATLGIGIFAAKKAARVSTGTIAGLWAGVIGGCVALVISEIVTVAWLREVYATTDPSILSMQIIAVTLGYLLLWGCGIGVGAGMGALGGLIGKSLAPVPVITYQAAMPHVPTPAYQPPYSPAQMYQPSYPQASVPPQSYPPQVPLSQQVPFSQHMPAQRPPRTARNLPPQE